MSNTQTTRRRIVLLAAVAILLLLNTAASAQPGRGYAVEEGTIAGGSYRLTGLAPPIDDMMSGGNYQLFNAATATTRGSGCCCTYLPCIPRNW